MTGFKLRVSGVESNLDLYVKTRKTATWSSSGGSLHPTRAYVLHPIPSRPMPCSLQEMAGRWCHQSVCLVLTIDINGSNNYTDWATTTAHFSVSVSLYICLSLSSRPCPRVGNFCDKAIFRFVPRSFYATPFFGICSLLIKMD